MSTRAFIFDMDGTMIDSMPSHAESWLVFAKMQGLTIDLPDLMAKTMGRTGHECIEIVLNRRVDKAEALALIAQKESAYRDIFGPKFREVAGFKQFTSEARTRGLALGIGTAGDQHNIAFVMKHLAMAVPIEVIVGGDQGFAGKPEPAIFLEVARRLGVKPSDCIVFEDAPFGIEAAGRAGMKAIAITSSHSASELAGEHVIADADNFDQLMSQKLFDSLALSAAH